jgi:hypothetical protein
MSTGEPLPAPDYERTDASPGMVALIAFVLAAIVAVGLVIGWWLYHYHDRGEAVTAAPTPGELFQHGVNEQTGIERAWQEQDRMVHEHLETYGWVDHAAGVVHIPISRAMGLMLAGAKPRETPPVQNHATP